MYTLLQFVYADIQRLFNYGTASTYSWSISSLLEMNYSRPSRCMADGEYHISLIELIDIASVLFYGIYAIPLTIQGQTFIPLERPFYLQGPSFPLEDPFIYLSRDLVHPFTSSIYFTMQPVEVTFSDIPVVQMETPTLVKSLGRMDFVYMKDISVILF